jgi:hypothetical protein
MKQELMEQKIKQARELLTELDRDKKESPFEKARRFLIIQEALIRTKKVNVEN